MSDWRDQAACRDTDPELFSPTSNHDHARIAAARAVCAPCPSRTPCLDDALRARDDHTIRAGTTGTQRREIRAAERREAMTR